ncbi:hypothetical protein Sru01_21710 [Sphaerisporangium rufum]|uniref:Histidine kinase/HSP90-like ATPase domain-containing protein n=1 Tax=Sphaerisporangium rufum TaxID=1381558 RepID=A0A919UYW6_9ACTN|nr:ATP-binding protein [Sphaerisporangium rufum]GII77189.1 hypothetical protein Sru01_21710 [Sphaerisporangium rufum]
MEDGCQAQAAVDQRPSWQLEGTLGLPAVSRRFAPRAELVREVRGFVSGLLGAGHPHLDDVILLTSELAANVVRHAPGQDFLVSVAFPGGGVLVAVTDGGSAGSPRLRRAADDEVDGRGLVLVDGRGLVLVDGLAARWGFERGRRGTVVWFELDEPNALDESHALRGMGALDESNAPGRHGRTARPGQAGPGGLAEGRRAGGG